MPVDIMNKHSYIRLYGCFQNKGTHKSSILIGFSIINHPLWGTVPLFLETQISVLNPFSTILPSSIPGQHADCKAMNSSSIFCLNQSWLDKKTPAKLHDACDISFPKIKTCVSFGSTLHPVTVATRILTCLKKGIPTNLCTWPHPMYHYESCNSHSYSGREMSCHYNVFHRV